MGAEMSTDNDREVHREPMYADQGAFFDDDAPNVSHLLDEVFDMITKIIRQRFGLGIAEAELILRDARNEAGNLFDGI
jgi:hypothetical protein